MTHPHDTATPRQDGDDSYAPTIVRRYEWDLTRIWSYSEAVDGYRAATLDVPIGCDLRIRLGAVPGGMRSPVARWIASDLYAYRPARVELVGLGLAFEALADEVRTLIESGVFG